MNKQELISMYERINNFSEYVSTEKVIKNIQQLDDRPKPVIPHFVAEIIEYYKRNNATLYDALREKNFNKQYSEWLLNEQNAYDKVAKAWLDGYEVEKEKRYKVVMPNVSSSGGVLTRIKHDESWIWIDTLGTIVEGRTHTRKELEDAEFGWVFDCPGIEVEEVE